MQCPDCSKEMAQQNYEGVIIDRCTSCEGVWLDDKEIQTIVKTKLESFSESEKLSAITKKNLDLGNHDQKKCLICSSSLEKMQYAVTSGVIIDRCPQKHGIYLDKGELKNIQILMEEYDRLYNLKDNSRDAYLAETKLCPKDREPLLEITYETERLDTCPKCKGIWCDGDELGKIIESREKEFSKQDQPEIAAKENQSAPSETKELIPAGSCVYCSDLMQKVNYSYSSGIIIEKCKHQHGVWLDAGEIESVQIFVERWEKQEKKVNTRYADALREAKDEIETKYEKMLQERKVSRFPAVNRFFRWLG